MRISRLSSDVCSSDLFGAERRDLVHRVGPDRPCFLRNGHTAVETGRIGLVPRRRAQNVPAAPATPVWPFRRVQAVRDQAKKGRGIAFHTIGHVGIAGAHGAMALLNVGRSEEHTSELQSLM